MENDGLSVKSLVLWFFSGLVIVILVFLWKRDNFITKAVFCDVGQGNAAHLRIYGGLDLIIDTGPDMSVLSCLGKTLPLYDRKIELVVITHPDSDHYGGLGYLMERYEIGEIIVDYRKKDDKSFNKLKNKIASAGITVKRKIKGDKIQLGNGTISFHWPSVEFDSLSGNDAGSILSYEENGFRLLFTGDSSPNILNRLSSRDIKGVDVMVVPHHGSKNGLTEKFLRLADPRLAVISVGKNNRFRHPHKTILDLLDAKGVKILRTDEYGDINITLGESTLFP